MSDNFFKNVQNEYSINKARTILEDGLVNITTFTKKTYVIFSIINLLLLLISLFFEKQLLFIISFVLLMKCISSISNIDGYREGSSDGINIGFEYGQIYGDLEILSSENKENRLNSRLWYLLYKDWQPDQENNRDHYLLKKFLDKNYFK